MSINIMSTTAAAAPAAAALRWLSLVGAIWLQSVNGTNFNFPAYSSQLKELLSISQLQLNNLAFASDAGKLFGWVSGVAAVHLPLWLVLLIGSFLGLVGYGVQLLFLTNQIPALSYWHVFFLSTLAGNSICWINTICCTTAVTNFPRNRQFAVGLSTSYQGLSAKIYMDIADAVMHSSGSGSGSPHTSIERAKFYLFLNSFLPLSVCIITMPFVRKISGSSHLARGGAGSGRGFVVFLVITIATGMFAVISCLASISIRPTIIGLGVLLAVPLVVPLVADLKFRQMLMGRSEERTANYEARVHSVVELKLEVEVGDERFITTGVHDHRDGATLKEAGNGGDGHDGDEGLVVEEIGVSMMLRRLNFWLYFFVYLFGATIGFVFLNNLGQIAESRGFPGTASLVSLSSSFGFFGRLVPSLLEYFFSRKVYLSTPLSMAVLMAPMSAAFLALLNGSNGVLYLSTAMIGVCTGGITSVAVSLTTELFGAKNFSVNHNVLVANIPIGSFVFGSTAAVLYRRAATEEGGGRCMGTECYRHCFIIWASLCSFGTILALILYARTRKFYSQNQKP